ncbi:B1 protein-like [Zophobas morio]|uniref:B1 protein-like n=1 Tax=Zophobas morio TaxID=2755281 RepID=UPI00308392AA
MNFSAFLFVSLFVYTQCDPQQHAIEACEQKSGITKEILQDLRAGKFDNPKAAPYLLCTHKVIGFQNEAGELQADKIEYHLKKVCRTQEQMQLIEQQCLHNKETPEKTALEFIKCSYIYLYGNTN